MTDQLISTSCVVLALYICSTQLSRKEPSETLAMASPIETPNYNFDSYLQHSNTIDSNPNRLANVNSAAYPVRNKNHSSTSREPLTPPLTDLNADAIYMAKRFPDPYAEGTNPLAASPPSNFHLNALTQLEPAYNPSYSQAPRPSLSHGSLNSMAGNMFARPTIVPMHSSLSPNGTAVSTNLSTQIPEYDVLPFQGVRHMRSHSHNISDQYSVNRMVLNFPSSPIQRIRPRAFSSSVPSGRPPSLSFSFESSPFEYSENMANSSSSAFPPPLSSPVSPTPASNSVATSAAVTMTSPNAKSKSANSATQPVLSSQVPKSPTRSYMSLHSSAHVKSPFTKQSPMRRSTSSVFVGDMENEESSQLQVPVTNSNSSHTPGHNRTRSASKIVPGPAISVRSLSDEQILVLCRDQRGCRYLQRKLNECDADVVNRIVEATKDQIVLLMIDPFGNYFCQKLFESCTSAQVTEFLRVCSPTVSTIAVNQHGTRALQKLMERITTKEQIFLLVDSLRNDVVRLIRDLNGNHVIQKLLLTMNGEDVQFIYDAACDSVIEVGSHRHGCCVLQRCLTYASPENRRKLVCRIIEEALSLVGDPFGNYVCQYVFDLQVQEFTDGLVAQFVGKLLFLSMQKFSSNVVEKSLRSSSPYLIDIMVDEILQPDILHELLLDNYGNYVIQTALDVSACLGPVKRKHVATTVQTALSTTKSPYGRRIMTKLKNQE